jgi:serine/threonine protein kinase
VVNRIAHGIDKVSYTDPSSGKKEVATFKFAFNRDVAGGGLWTDIHVLGRLRPHSNIVSLLSLVVEEISGLGVVGFTMPFMDGYTLSHQQAPWSFSQKWLHGLTGAVDFLNLQHGILHSDIVAQNIFINTETNSLVLLDLGSATHAMTWRTDRSIWGQGMSPTEGMQVAAQRDVEHTILAVASRIVRDPSLCPRSIGERSEIGRRLKNRELWVRYAEVELDVDILALEDTLMTWSNTRRDGPLPCDAPHPISWPPYTLRPPETEEDPADGPSLNWVRPTCRSSTLTGPSWLSEGTPTRSPIPSSSPPRTQAKDFRNVWLRKHDGWSHAINLELPVRLVPFFVSVSALFSSFTL